MFIESTPNQGRLLASRKVYAGPVFDVLKQTIQTPDGLQVERDLIKHAQAVAVLAITEDDLVLVNREYRVGINAEAYALPAGLMDPKEAPEAAAARELQEETGYLAQHLTKLCTIRSSEGMTDETVHLFVAAIDPNQRTTTAFDHDEFVTTALVPLPEVIAAVQGGQIQSAQSVAALTYYLAFVRATTKERP